MNQPTDVERGAREEPRGDISHVAFILVVLALLLALGHNTFYLARERRNLQTVRENQQTALRQAERLRAQFDSIAKRTLQLAQQGNAGAAIIVENLTRRGVTINPGPTPTK